MVVSSLSLVAQDTIIDSVYSDADLDGYLIYSPEGLPIYINTGSYGMIAGDVGISSVEPAPPPNSTDRSFITYQLPEIPIGYEVENVVMRLYQYNANGGLPSSNFPVWNVVGGDTIKCILSHIDYGYELDWDDWEKGDIGNPYTFTHNAGIVTDSGEDGYRYLDVTDHVLLDYQQERIYSQFRISFQIDTDGDDYYDKVAYGTSDSNLEYGIPRIYLLYSDLQSSEDYLLKKNYTLLIYPNPISNTGKIKFDYPISNYVSLRIYNMKGQLVQSVFNGNIKKGENEFLIHTNMLPNGVYLIKAQLNQQYLVKKIIKLK